MSDQAPAASSGEERVVQWRAVWIGALVGLGVLVVVSVIEAILDNNIANFADTGWIYPLFVGVLVGYALGGYVAGRAAPDGALTNGALAGLGSFVLWIPVRIVIWLVRDEDKGLFTGHSPILRPGQVFGHLVIAAALGMLGGWLGARSLARERARTSAQDGPPPS
ncbi:MAG TPA: YrzE family protein [Acidimicrobiia bacterium]|nr:YrzE family protein [Acidimicrobiia bacterium]